MTTLDRADINRANAQHSTGPKTEAGKKKSSLNSLRHGLTSQTVVVPPEDLKAYQRHLRSFLDEYHPSGATESHLVQALADCSWRLNRILALETKVLAGADLEIQSKALSSLSLYSQRLSRQFEKAVTQLRDLQEIRREQERHSLDQYLDITEMYKNKGATYDPSEDGFAFSEHQINEAILRRNREREAQKADDYWETAA